MNVRVGLYGSEDDLEQALRELEACRDWREFRNLSEAITLYSTPAETHGIITRMRHLLSFKPGDRIRHPVSTLVLELKRQWWRHSILWELSRMRSATARSLSWVREPFCEDAALYLNPNVAPRNKSLIVGFTGISNRLMMPAYKFLRCIDPNHFDVLLVRDRKRKHYAYGILGMSDTLDGVARALEEFAQKKSYLRSIAFGTSAGGLASIYVAIKNQWDRVVAVGADDPSRHPILADLLNCITSRPDQNGETRIHLCYSEKNTRDSTAATKNVVIFSQARLFPDTRFHVHNLLYRLYKNGELPGFLAQQFGSESPNNPQGGSNTTDNRPRIDQTKT